MKIYSFILRNIINNMIDYKFQNRFNTLPHDDKLTIIRVRTPPAWSRWRAEKMFQSKLGQQI